MECPPVTRVHVPRLNLDMELLREDSKFKLKNWKVLTHLAAVRAAISAEDGWSPAQHRHSPACSLFLHPALDLNNLIDVRSR